jgi:hypothetical protein
MAVCIIHTEGISLLGNEKQPILDIFSSGPYSKGQAHKDSHKSKLIQSLTYFGGQKGGKTVT